MDKLPSAIIQHIHEYDNIYKIKFDSFKANDGSLFHL